MRSYLSMMENALRLRQENQSLRQLPLQRSGIDFYSNDYLGLARNHQLHNNILQRIESAPELLAGSTGSRLISGSSGPIRELESLIAQEHGTTSALFFGSGYSANLALFSSLPQRNDTILVDECIHRSVHDGCCLSNARKFKFPHNDMNRLEMLLKKTTGRCLVAVESLYSMEGDFAPLKELVFLTEKYGAGLIVDEAHSLGVFGVGLVAELSLQEHVLATIVTYGKALGLHGASILSGQILNNYLVNFASPFIYTTAPGPLAAISIAEGYRMLRNNDGIGTRLQERIRQFRASGLLNRSMDGSPVQVVECIDKRQTALLQQTLTSEGLNTYLVKAPAVKAGSERIRICLHAFNTASEVNTLTDILNNHLPHH